MRLAFWKEVLVNIPCVVKFSELKYLCFKHIFQMCLLPYLERKAYTVLIIEHAIIRMADGALHLKYIPGSDDVHPVLCCTITCKNKTRERACNACADGLTQLPVIS